MQTSLSRNIRFPTKSVDDISYEIFQDLTRDMDNTSGFWEHHDLEDSEVDRLVQAQIRHEIEYSTMQSDRLNDEQRLNRGIDAYLCPTEAGPEDFASGGR